MNKGTQGQAKAKGYAMGTVMGMLTPLRSYFEGDKYAREGQELTFNMRTVLAANVVPAVNRTVVPYTKHAASEVWYTRAMANLDEEISTAKEWEQTTIKESKKRYGVKGNLWRDDEAVMGARRDLSNTLLKKAVMLLAILDPIEGTDESCCLEALASASRLKNSLAKISAVSPPTWRIPKA